jgi:primosomal protein N' (replication factor Y) (superfamily II helicase)
MSQLSLITTPDPPRQEIPDYLVTVVVPPLDGEYLYALNPAIAPEVSVGCILEVQLGRRAVPGFVVSANSERERRAAEEVLARGIKIKSIATTSRPIKAFTEKHLAFFEWIAKYYAEPLSKILDVAVPTPAFGRKDPFITLVSPTPELKRGAAQQRVIDFLTKEQGWTQVSVVRQACDVSSAIIRTLEEKGFIQSALIPPSSEEPRATHVATSLIDSLSTEQRDATLPILSHVTNKTFSSYLLHGVTGSGKTEVYLELIIEALKHGRSALVVVPEIALTPQLLDRFENRLGQRVAVLHSSLKPHQRWQHWASVLSGETKIVIGARSAIFAPMKDLGVIVVDEEHDGSFKQGEGIRYNARDLAVVRAKLVGCPIVLGSATPSLESFHHAKTGKHQLLTLKSRFFTSRPLSFDLVDLNRLKPWEMPSRNISPKLLTALKEALQSGEQAFVLYNRRGFASYLQCTGCETVVGCPHCSVTLTYHRNSNSLLCHFCGFTTPPPVACSSCGAKDPRASGNLEAEPLFKQRGAGTERVFEEISELLPSARIAKLDRDAVKTIDDYTAVLHKMRAKEIDILVGTQMIAKGHDLPDVTLVGIVDCDVGLHVPDFRAGERAFQLLTQVAGRAGRREKQGHVILQTRVPQHPSLRMTIAADYHGFARQELEMRQMLGYPPYQRLLRIIVGAEDKNTASTIANHIAARATEPCEALGITLLGPAPAPVEKVRNYWRFHILFKAQSAAKLQNLMLRLKRDSAGEKNARIVFDLDPQDML